MSKHHKEEPGASTPEAAELMSQLEALGRMSWQALAREYVQACRAVVEADAKNLHEHVLFHRDFAKAVRWAIIVGTVLNDTDAEEGASA